MRHPVYAERKHWQKPSNDKYLTHNKKEGRFFPQSTNLEIKTTFVPMEEFKKNLNHFSPSFLVRRSKIVIVVSILDSTVTR